MSKLLISVRTAHEARLALEGGASLLDVKEPARGSLGRAPAETFREIQAFVAGRLPLSAALGELRDWTEGDTLPGEGLAFVKWGLSRAPEGWAERIVALRQEVERSSDCKVVLVSYADHRRALAPTPAEILHLAVRQRFSVMLVDTFEKDGTTLLDWISATDLGDIISACHEVGVRVALAGSLGRREIGLLMPLRPEWFAVRGAVCEHEAREGQLQKAKVEELISSLRVTLPAG